MQLDSANWSGEGTFTAVLIDVLKTVAAIEFLRVEDAPASRTDADYMFISNEVYVRFAAKPEKVPARLLGIPVRRTVMAPSMTLVDLEAALTATGGIGAPDYSDETMLQYLRTERIVPPYQTRGYKLVEMVRVYALTAAAMDRSPRA